MRFFSRWFGTSQANANTGDASTLDILEEHIEQESQYGNDQEERKKTKEQLKELLAKMHHLAVTSLSERGMYKVKEDGPESGWLQLRSVVQEKMLSFDALLDHLMPVKRIRVRFIGSFEKVRNLLEAIPKKWFAEQHSVIIEITDGLRNRSTVQRNDWMYLILRIRNAYGESFNEEYCKLFTGPGIFHNKQMLQGVCWKEFLVKCPSMDIPPYDAIQAMFFTDDQGLGFRTKNGWELARSIIEAEAEFFEESDNKIEFEMNGKKRMAVFEQKSQ